ncbi:MAG TPA: NADH-quinone oxidoreductase subunit N [Microscillaceae bacterium]|nr:NADH-quinone oxidoreductase subunit N [Microscillaceae bacterium]
MPFKTLTEALSHIEASLLWLQPELFLTFYALLVLVISLFRKKESWTFFRNIGILGVLVTLGLVAHQWHYCTCQMDKGFFFNFLHTDRLSIFTKFIAGGATLASLVLMSFAKRYAERLNQTAPVLVLLLLAMLLALHLLAMSRHLFMLFLAVEFTSIAAYLLTAIFLDKKTAEGSLKYMLFGAFSSGLMLYGMSFLYGFSGMLDFGISAFWQNLAQAPPLFVGLALGLTLSGLLFKLTAVPFHFWAPDVYESVPSPVAALFSIAPKAATLAVLVRLSDFLQHLQLPQFFVSAHWVSLFALVAMVTMTLGNLAALWQTNLKRLLAYSSVANAGFLIAGLAVPTAFAGQSLFFFLLAYTLMNYAAFYCIDLFNTPQDEIEALRGLGKQYPWQSAAFTLTLVSLAGLPPTVGFTAKFLIFSAIWQHYQAVGQNTLLLLFLVSLFNAVVGLFYYLKIPYYLYFKSTDTQAATPLALRWQTGLIVFVLCFPLLLFFFKADWLMYLLSWWMAN